MTAKIKQSIPVDQGDPTELDDASWDRDDRPDRFHKRIQADDDARARYEAALSEIEEHQATLAQVRKARSLTQTTIAMLLEMDQSEVSRLERRSDMLLSTLRSFIQAAGGELQLIATFPESAPIQLLVGPEPLPEKEASPMPSNARKEETGKKAASAAGRTLRSKTASKKAKSAAASALAQTGNKKVTGKKAASAAGRTLRSKTASKKAKSAAASTLTQRSGKGRRRA